MPEIIITCVMLETHGSVTYPVTKIFRIEFDTEERMNVAVESLLHESAGIVHAEQLIGGDQL